MKRPRAASICAPPRASRVSAPASARRAREDAQRPRRRRASAAFRAAGEPLAEAALRAGWAISDHTFEARRILEWQAAVTRTHALWGEPHRLDSPAQRIGNLGAAALLLAMVLAAEGWRRHYAPSGIALAFAGSDAGERGALLLVSNV